MRRRISYIMITAFILCFPIAVYAESGSSHGYTPDDTTTLDQQITTTLPEGLVQWHLVIPADVTIEKGGYMDGHIDIGKVKIEIDSGEIDENYQINAYLKYDGKLIQTQDAVTELKYNLSPKNPRYNGEGEGYETFEVGTLYNVGFRDEVNEQYTSPDAWVTLDDWRAALEGDYEGTVVYSSKLVEKNQ